MDSISAVPNNDDRTLVEKLFRSPIRLDYPRANYKPNNPQKMWDYIVPQPDFTQSPPDSFLDGFPGQPFGRVIAKPEFHGGHTVYTSLSLRWNIDRLPPHPGVQPSELQEFLHPSYITTDGSQGPYDARRYPQLFDRRRPWLGFHSFYPMQSARPFHYCNAVSFFDWNSINEDNMTGGSWDMGMLERLLDERHREERQFLEVLRDFGDPEGTSLKRHYGPALPFFDSLSLEEISEWKCWSDGRDVLGHTLCYVGEIAAMRRWLSEVDRQRRNPTSTILADQGLSGVWIGSIASAEDFNFCFHAPIPLFGLFTIQPGHHLYSQGIEGGLDNGESYRTDPVLSQLTGFPTRYDIPFSIGRFSRPLDMSQLRLEPMRIIFPPTFQVREPGSEMKVPYPIDFDYPYTTYLYKDRRIQWLQADRKPTSYEQSLGRRVNHVAKCTVKMPATPLAEDMVPDHLPYHPISSMLPPRVIGDRRPRQFIEYSSGCYHWAIEILPDQFSKYRSHHPWKYNHSLGLNDFLYSHDPWPSIDTTEPPNSDHEVDIRYDLNPKKVYVREPPSNIMMKTLREICVVPKLSNQGHGARRGRKRRFNSNPSSDDENVLDLPAISIPADIPLVDRYDWSEKAAEHQANFSVASFSVNAHSPQVHVASGPTASAEIVSPLSTASAPFAFAFPPSSSILSSMNIDTPTPARLTDLFTFAASPSANSDVMMDTHAQVFGPNENMTSPGPSASIVEERRDNLSSDTESVVGVQSSQDESAMAVSGPGIISTPDEAPQMISEQESSIPRATQAPLTEYLSQTSTTANNSEVAHPGMEVWFLGNDQMNDCVERIRRGRRLGETYLKYRLNAPVVQAPNTIRIQEATLTSSTASPSSRILQCYPLRMSNVDVGSSQPHMAATLMLAFAERESWGDIAVISVQVETDGTISVDIGFRFIEDALVMWSRNGRLHRGRYWNINPISAILGICFISRYLTTNPLPIPERLRRLGLCYALEERVHAECNADWSYHRVQLRGVMNVLVGTWEYRVDWPYYPDHLQLFDQWKDIFIDGHSYGWDLFHKAQKVSNWMIRQIRPTPAQWTSKRASSSAVADPKPDDMHRNTGLRNSLLASLQEMQQPQVESPPDPTSPNMSTDVQLAIRTTRSHARIKYNSWKSPTLRLSPVPVKAEELPAVDQLLEIWHWYDECAAIVREAFALSGLSSLPANSNHSLARVVEESFYAAERSFSPAERLKKVYGSTYNDLMKRIQGSEDVTPLLWIDYQKSWEMDRWSDSASDDVTFMDTL